MKAVINLKSVKKRSNTEFVGQVEVTLDDGHKSYFAVCTHEDDGQAVVNTNNIYQYVNAKWVLVTAGAEVLALVADSFNKYVGRYKSLFKRKLSDSKGDYWVMYSDTLIGFNEDDTWQQMKIGDLLIIATRDSLCDSFVFESRDFGAINDDASDYAPPPAMQKRIDKQLGFGSERAYQSRLRAPCGPEYRGYNPNFRKVSGPRSFRARQHARSYTR